MLNEVLIKKDIRFVRIGKFQYPKYKDAFNEYKKNAARLRFLYNEMEKTFKADKANYVYEIELLVDRQILIHDKAMKIIGPNWDDRKPNICRTDKRKVHGLSSRGMGSIVNPFKV